MNEYILIMTNVTNDRFISRKQLERKLSDTGYVKMENVWQKMMEGCRIITVQINDGKDNEVSEENITGTLTKGCITADGNSHLWNKIVSYTTLLDIDTADNMCHSAGFIYDILTKLMSEYEHQQLELPRTVFYSDDSPYNPLGGNRYYNKRHTIGFDHIHYIQNSEDVIDLIEECPVIINQSANSFDSTVKQ